MSVPFRSSTLISQQSRSALAATNICTAVKRNSAKKKEPSNVTSANLVTDFSDSDVFLRTDIAKRSRIAFAKSSTYLSEERC